MIKQSIEYAKKYPGRNLTGLSINAKGASGEKIDFEGEAWNAVDQFTAVKRVDLVTDPARGGKFEQILSECKKTQFTQRDFDLLLMESDAELYPEEKCKTAESAESIFSALNEKVRELEKTNAPGLADVRRQLDQLGTALKINKSQEESMIPVPAKPPGEAPVIPPVTPPEEQKPNFAKLAETAEVLGQTEPDALKKAFYTSASEAFKKMAEGESVTPPAPQAEEEGEDEGEGEAAGKPKTESKTDIDYKAEYERAEKEKICTKAGLDKTHREYVLTLFESEKDMTAFKSKVEKYANVNATESRRPHNFERKLVEQTSGRKRIVSALEADGVLDMN
jgi:hypothetical protein